MILLIDNYDSFTHNLYDYICQSGAQCIVKRNDEISIDEIRALNPKGIVLSPGPGRPKDAGILMQIVKEFSDELPILGICLGHQAIGEHFGARLVKASKPMHGKTSMINLSKHFIFERLSTETEVMRYHSLILEDLPHCLVSIATSPTGENMAFAHKELSVIGIQFHPESILTKDGLDIIRNWIGSLETTDSN